MTSRLKTLKYIIVFVSIAFRASTEKNALSYETPIHPLASLLWFLYCPLKISRGDEKIRVNR